MVTVLVTMLLHRSMAILNDGQPRSLDWRTIVATASTPLPLARLSFERAAEHAVRRQTERFRVLSRATISNLSAPTKASCGMDAVIHLAALATFH